MKILSDTPIELTNTEAMIVAGGSCACSCTFHYIPKKWQYSSIFIGEVVSKDICQSKCIETFTPINIAHYNSMHTKNPIKKIELRTACVDGSILRNYIHILINHIRKPSNEPSMLE